MWIFVHMELESNTLDLGFGEDISNITHLIQRTQRRRRKKEFFLGGFGFAGRDGNRGVDLVLPWVGLILP